jgi:hypothetical protein
MASLKAARERCARKPRPRLAGVATPGPSGDSSAAHPPAAPAAARAAAQTHAHGQVTQDSDLMFQRARAIRDAAATPARSAEQHEAAPVRSPGERARNISSAAASRSRSRAAADDVADTSSSDAGSSYAPSIADGAPEPGGAAGSGPRAGGASKLRAVRCCWPSGPGGGDCKLQIVMTERAGPLLCALTNTAWHAASSTLCLICTLARR